MVLTRVGCHLCETAERDAGTIARAERVSVEFIDVDRCDPDVRAAWTDHVPVTVVDGRVIAIWAVDAARLHAALAADMTHNHMHNASTSGPSPEPGETPWGAEGSGR